MTFEDWARTKKVPNVGDLSLSQMAPSQRNNMLGRQIPEAVKR